MYLQGLNPNEYSPLSLNEKISFIEAHNTLKKFAKIKFKFPIILQTSVHDILFDLSNSKLLSFLIFDDNIMQIFENMNEQHNGYKSNKYNIKSIQNYKTDEKEKVNYHEFLNNQQLEQKKKQEQEQQQQQKLQDRIRQHAELSKKIRDSKLQEMRIMEQQRNEQEEALKNLRLKEQMDEIETPMKRENTQPGQNGGKHIQYKIKKYSSKLDNTNDTNKKNIYLKKLNYYNKF
jgi:hypothetical protein